MVEKTRKITRVTDARKSIGHSDEFSALPRSEGQTLADTAYQRLSVDIIRGERTPGERLRIEKLKNIYGIGPTPLREALQKLTADHLVTTEGNRGFMVAPLISGEFQDLNIARTAIEKEAIRLSIANGGNQWEAQIVAAHYLLSKEDKLLSSARDRIPDSWEFANAAFHTAVVAACGSTWLLRARANLVDLVERYRRASLYQKMGQRDLEQEHAAILEAVLNHNAELACELTERHFEITTQSLIEAATIHESVEAVS